jgi:multicomponent Na+:H+ antiporter subunit G
MGVYNLLVIFLLVSGLFFFFAGAVGILRFPDFYSRMHPAGKLDTMGLFTTMTAMALWVVHEWTLGAVLTALKILLIVAFVFITSPTATHAIVDAGVRAGLLPWVKENRRDSK